MKPAVYTMPRAPRRVVVKHRADFAALEARAMPEIVTVDKATECHITPPDVAARMVEYLGELGDKQTLEPSAGTGALAQALIDGGLSRYELTLIERNIKLSNMLHRFDGPGVINECFLDYAKQATGKIEFVRILMNPPFRAVRQHVAAARRLLGSNGHQCAPCLVALVPITYQADGMETLEELPRDTFSTAAVSTKIIRFYA